jgi:hypothetical protein
MCEQSKDPKRCLKCNKIIEGKKKFCDQSCSASFNNIKRLEGGYKPNGLKTSETMKRLHLEGKINLPRVDKLEKECKGCGKTFFVLPSGKDRKYCSEDCYKKDPLAKKTSGGYRPTSGRGKCGWYMGYWCQSSWELAFIIYHIDKCIKFDRNKEGFKYIFEGKEHIYYPDFKKDNEYIEVKGYMSKQVIAKIEQFPHKLVIIDKKGIIPYVEYVEEKYGKDFIRLYDVR